MLVGADRAAVLEEHRAEDRARLRQRRVARARAAEARDRGLCLLDHIAVLGVTVEVVRRERAERGHVQLRGADELPVGRRTRVRDGSPALSADDKDERAHGEDRQSESRSRSEAGLHSASFGGCAAETGSLVWVIRPKASLSVGFSTALRAETRAGRAGALQGWVGRSSFPCGRGDASRRRVASVRLRLSRLRLAYPPASV